MCNCISDLEKRLLVHYPVHSGKKVSKVTANAMYIVHDGKMTKSTYTEFDLQKEGIKKEVPIKINHNFCPFCGVEYPKPN